MLEAGYGPLTAVHDSAKVTLGTRYEENGKVYIYLKGAASVVAKDVVTYDENYAVTRLVANAVGPVAVALAAVVANKYGWFQIYGNASVNSDTVAADKALYIDASTGRVDDAAVTGDLILGMTSTDQDTTNVLPVFLNYPHVTDILG